MRFSVLLFAGVRARIGAPRVDLELPADARVADLLRALGERYPAAAELLATCRVAIDLRFVGHDARLDPAPAVEATAGPGDRGEDLPRDPPGDPPGERQRSPEIAVIPPVSGGHDGPPPAESRVHLTTATLDLGPVVAAVSHAAAGGITSFVGNVRDHSHGQRIVYLEYEAYEPMARRVMAAIVGTIEAAIAGSRVAIHHRLGRLAIGESAVIIAASAAHRAEAFDACRRAIEALKREVPIWKREVAEGGDTWYGRGP